MIMARPVLDKADLIFIATLSFRHFPVQDATNLMGHVYVRLLIVSADQISVSRLPLFKNDVQCTAVIIYKQPITYIVPCPVNGNWFPGPMPFG